MAGIRSLAKDTVLYGLSSIIGRFLNWLLVPLYVYKLQTQGEYGTITFLYSWMALLIILLTYGMETGFFRFANDKEEKDPDSVYSTTMISIGSTSGIFILLLVLFLNPLSRALNLESHPDYVLLMGIIIGLDAFTSIPFAYLRYCKRPLRFAAYKLVSIGVNIGLNLFFFLLCPLLVEKYPDAVSSFYNPRYGVDYILISNLISTITVCFLLLPEILKAKFKFRPLLLKKMLAYSLPLLVLGIAGIMNQNIDKMLYPYLIEDKEAAMAQLGIYGANFKIALLMMLFTQAFRYAYDPFIFAREKGEDKRPAFALAMKYFILCGIFIFLGVMFYIDIIKYFIKPTYFEGLRIVPIVMAGQLFSGIFFNLSLWYKLTDKTEWGAYFSLIGFGIIVAGNLIFVPRYGYTACAWAGFACYLAMMLASYFVGKRRYPIAYDLKSIGKYGIVALFLYITGMHVTFESPILRLGIRTVILAGYVLFILKNEPRLREVLLALKRHSRQ